jgi:hypothetical protein
MAFMDYMPQFGQNIPNQTVGAQTPQLNDITAQLLLKRRLAQADALRNAEMPQGQMVSGHYVAPSWTQYLANIANQYVGGKEEEKAMQQYGEYETGKQKRLADALEQYNKDIADRTVQPEQQAPTITGSTGEMAPNMGMVNAPARTVPVSAADRYNALMRYSAATQNPELTQRAMLGGIELAGKQEETAGERKWREQQTRNEQEFQRIRDKERNNQELTMSEKNFANQMALQKSRQGFEAGENALNRANQIKIHSMTGAGGKPTEFQEKAGLYAKSMNQASTTLNALESKGINIAPTYPESVLDESTKVGQIGLSKVRSDDRKSYVQAQKQWIDSINRVRSGANLPEIEYNRAVATFFPEVNDSPERIEQKRLARAGEEANMKTAAGRAIPNQQKQPTAKNIVRTGTDKTTGRKVVQYEDGTTAYAQ